LGEAAIVVSHLVLDRLLAGLEKDVQQAGISPARDRAEGPSPPGRSCRDRPDGVDEGPFRRRSALTDRPDELAFQRSSGEAMS